VNIFCMTNPKPPFSTVRLLTSAACILIAYLPLDAQEAAPAAPSAPASPSAPAAPPAPAVTDNAPATIEAVPPKPALPEPIVAEAPASEDSPSTPSQPAATKAATNNGKISFSSCTVEGKEIAITFDDGPHKTNTPQLLDILKQRGIRATFFVVGQNAAEYPDILKRIVAEGHELANHSYTHPVLASMSQSAVHEQLDKTHQAVLKATGVSMKLLRPPYGALSEPQRRTVNNEFGYKVILWSVDPLDWKVRDAARVQNEIVSHTQAGSIVLAHDIHKSTVDAMPETLDKLTEKGFKFVTVSELLALDRPAAPKPAADPSTTPAPASKPTSQPKKEEKKTFSIFKSSKPAAPGAPSPAPRSTASSASSPSPKPAAPADKTAEKASSTPAPAAKKPSQLSEEEIKKKWLESFKR
jgi:peptidoglycan/xylan/chitin deacetylase (PgdA/CDA1 family)